MALRNPSQLALLKRRTKFSNRRMVVDGITFHSKKEADRWTTLRCAEKAGLISKLQRQVRFTLVPTQRVGKKTFRPLTYIADFTYERDGQAIAEDCKGYRTQTYIDKQKLMLYLKGILIVET